MPNPFLVIANICYSNLVRSGLERMGDQKWRAIAGLCLTISLTTISTLADPIEKRPLDEPILFVGVSNMDLGGAMKKNFLIDQPSGTVIVEPNVRIRIQAFGQLLAGVKAVLFTTSHDLCEPFVASASEADFGLDQEHTITFNVSLPKDQTTYYICFSFEDMPLVQYHLNRSLPLTRTSEFIHQGSVPYVTIKTKRRIKEYYMDMWLQITVVVVLLILSGLFSGLNLGLMSLEKTELKILLKVGDARERSYAQKIYPIRKSGNYLLCTLLLGNVVVNSSISILFDDLTTGYVALIVASIGIVIFGEIVPQAICTRYGLAVGAHTVFLTRIFMILTFPLSYPISRILDKVLGEEVSRQVYNRERLLELIRMSKEQEGDLKNCQEVQIVTGALELSRKVVRDVMTNIKDVYMMPSDATLDPQDKG
uniref:CNNM transmembrane domain-containing protein n=1 Tax=Romanomermis culicivorax TaxID=13658 RepID=A0A915KAI1_ROMCU